MPKAEWKFIHGKTIGSEIDNHTRVTLGLLDLKDCLGRIERARKQVQENRAELEGAYEDMREAYEDAKYGGRRALGRRKVTTAMARKFITQHERRGKQNA